MTTLKCPVCEDTFVTIAGLQAHLEVHLAIERVIASQERNRPPRVCRSCGAPVDPQEGETLRNIVPE